jgi:hypothetical protein
VLFVLIFINLLYYQLKNNSMKKTLLSIILSSAFLFTSGQITVVKSNLLVVGDKFYEATDDNPSLILGSPGGNKTWNFSFLNAIDQDTIIIVAPGGTPYGSSYPNADLCMVQEEDGWGGPTTNYTYMSKDNSGIYILGESDVVLPLPTMFMPLPLTYGATHVDGPISADDEIYSGWQLDWYYPDTLAPLFTGGTCHTIDSALVSANITNSFEVDAWGTVTMPGGNDYDALRVMAENDYTYTVQIYCTDTLTGTGSGWYPGGGDSDISNEIFFISNHPDVRYPLVVLSMDSIYIEEASFLNGSALSSVNTIDASSFNVYPIPSSYNLTIETVLSSNDNNYELFDIRGSLIKKESFNQSTQIDLSQLAKGTYILKIHSLEGYINKKIIVE